MPVKFRYLTAFWGLLICCPLLPERLMANNGALAIAYPIHQIKIDGDLSDWSWIKTSYPIAIHLSDIKPRDASDFQAWFKIGYHLESRSLYIAVEVTDDDHIRDTAKNASWNSRDAVELDLDLLHLPGRSGVTSYLLSVDHKNYNKSRWDPVTPAGWDKTEGAVIRQGNKSFYEWRVVLEGPLSTPKSIGLDLQVFDKDAGGDFSYSAWGPEGYKYRNPNSLGDLILLKEGEEPHPLSGRVKWAGEKKINFPATIGLNSEKEPGVFLDLALDSTGRYSASVPAGSYRMAVRNPYLSFENKWYVLSASPSPSIRVSPGARVESPDLELVYTPVPGLIPAKGILHDFNDLRAKELDAFIETYQKQYQIPGVSLALIKDGKVIYSRAYGVKNSQTREKTDENTLYEAASVTKPVFAYAVMRLVEKGKIDLDKPLYEYLPYPDIAHDARYKKITARHVLSHRTGFPNWRYMNADGKLDIKFEPGSRYGYSGEGFEYLKKVVEKITGKKVEKVLREEVLDPLGLYHTYFSKNDTLAKLVATGHNDNIPSNDGLPEEPGMAYSMHTEAKAFTRFMLALLHQQGLKPETFREMLSLQSEYNTPEGQEKPKFREYMGISLAIRESPYGLVFGHGGNNGDFRCGFELYKDLKMGYVIFTNANSALPLIEAMPKVLVEGKE